MNTFGWSLVLGLVAALANLVGAMLVAQRNWQRHILKYFIALGSGFMLAVAFLEMVPSIELNGELAMGLVLAGYLLVHFFEHTITSHFHFGEETHPEAHIHPGVGYAALFGMLIHNFFDGAAIASGFILSPYLGTVIFLAVLLHKIPDGFTVASVVLAAGGGKNQALGASVLTGVATLAGVGFMWLIPGYVAYGLAISAGATLYVAASDLIPEVNREPGIMMAVWVFVGAALMVGLQLLVH